jgi:Right handed beta helix region
MAPRNGPPGRERYVGKLTGRVGLALLCAISAIAAVPAAQAAGPPAITGTDPNSPANQNNPLVKGTVGEGDTTQLKLYETPDCSGDPVAIGTVEEFTGTGIAVPVPDDAVTVLTAIATDAAGADSTCSDPFAYTEDSSGPAAPQITGTDPPSPGSSNNPGVKGTAGADASEIELYTNSSCTGIPAATGSAAGFTDAGIAVAVAEGTTTAFSATATDAAGNVSACSPPFTYTADPTGACDKIASPPGSTASAYQTPQELSSSLAAGQTGCFRAGTYTFSQTDVTTPNVTLAPYGSDAVTLKGTIKVKPGGAGSTIEGMKLDGAGGASNIGPRIYANAVVLRDNDITNDHTAICVELGSYYSNPPPQGVVIERNRIHDCGRLPSTNFDHGIYVGEGRETVIRDNWIYNNADRGIQLYPDAQHTMVTGNVIEGNGDGLVINGSGSTVSSDNVVEGNIIADSKLGWNVYSGDSGPVAAGNRLRQNCVWAGQSGPDYESNGGVETPSRNFTATANAVVDPHYSDPADGDYTLSSESRCPVANQLLRPAFAGSS